MKNKIQKNLKTNTNKIITLKEITLVTNAPKKNKISLEEKFKNHQGENLAKEFSWDNPVGKEIW